jgi:hypothetical protein
MLADVIGGNCRQRLLVARGIRSPIHVDIDF